MLWEVGYLRKREKIGDRGLETRRFRSVPRSFPGFLLDPGNILFVFLFAQVWTSPRLLFLVLATCAVCMDYGYHDVLLHATS